MVGKVSYDVLLYLSLVRFFDIFGIDFDISFMNFILIALIDKADKGTRLSILI